jgi:hypothetical protein
MAKHCGGKSGRGPKTVAVKRHSRSKPGPVCYGPGKPGPKTVSVRQHKRSKP